MNKRQFIQSSASTLLTLGILSTVSVAHADGHGLMKPGLEKCYGVAIAGQNDCAGISGLHSCKGQSTVSHNPGDVLILPAGTCAKIGGLDVAQAKEKLKMMSQN